MDIERKNATTLKGNPFTLVGPEIKVGQKAPDFTALAGDLSAVTLASSKGKARLICSVPSLDERLENVILKALEKDPAQRYPSAREMADDLRRDGQTVVFLAVDGHAVETANQFAVPPMSQVPLGVPRHTSAGIAVTTTSSELFATLLERCALVPGGGTSVKPFVSPPARPLNEK